jgi:hypothetical protein
MDFHRGAGGTNYPRTQRVGSGEVCTQLDCGTLLVPGAAPTSLSWFTGNVVKVFNVPVTRDHVPRLGAVSSGTSDFGLAAFRSNQVAGYAAGRGSAVALADRRGAGQGEGIYFEATANDTIGLVPLGQQCGDERELPHRGGHRHGDRREFADELRRHRGARLLLRAERWRAAGPCWPCARSPRRTPT